jgi:hypothetical protein
VPASADLVVYVDWSVLSKSPLLQGVESYLIEGEIAADVEAFRELTGMDPLEDVWAIAYFRTPEKDGGGSWGLACYGAFDPEQVIENLESRRRVPDRSQYRETTLYRVPGLGSARNADGEQVLAFPDGTTALFGHPMQVRAMLDAGLGFAAQASEKGELAVPLRGVTAAETIWAVGKGTRNLPGSAGAASSGIARIPPLVSFAVSARVGSRLKIRARGETPSAEAAGQLADLVRGFAAMGALAKKPDASLQEMYDSLEVETLDELVEMSFEVDADTVREFLRPTGSEERKRPARD